MTSAKTINEINNLGNNSLSNEMNVLQFCLFYSIKIFNKLRLTEPLEVNVINLNLNLDF
jgi:hypothetical protein